MANDDNGLNAGTVALAFLGGAAVGAGLALLYAPKTGKELRTNIKGLTDETLDKIKVYATEAQDKIKVYATEAQDKIKTTLEDGKELFNEKKSILSSAIEAGKEAMDKEKEKLKNA